jgi:tetratricopeptide (TPR) repeat protein
MWLCVGVLALAAGCGARAAARTTPSGPKTPAAPDDGARGGTRELSFEPVQIEVSSGPSGETTAVVTDARTLFDQGNDALFQRRFDDALVAYDTLIRDFPGSALVGAALYNAGVACEGKGDFAQAAERYRKALAALPTDTRDAIDTSFRLGAVLAELGRFDESQKVFEGLLDTDRLTPTERLEGLARLGFALVELKDYVGAEDVLRSALAYHKELAAAGSLDSKEHGAMAQYYLAVIAHRQFRAMPLRYPEEQMGRDLDRKSELFLLAQDRYWKVIDEYPNPYWTTAAVYQMGQMFLEFWDDFMAVPPPAGMTPEGLKEYVKLLNQNPQLRKLLEKSLYFHETNVVKAKEHGFQTVWIDGSVERARQVKALLERQQRGELFAPGRAPGGSDAPGAEGEAPTFGQPGAGSAPASSEYTPGRTNL